MKVNRYGRAEILTPQQISLLFSKGFVNKRGAAALAFSETALYSVSVSTPPPVSLKPAPSSMVT